MASNSTTHDSYSQPFTASNSAVISSSSWQVAGVEVPVRISEDHDNTATVTKFSVESGSQLSDHIILQPITLTIEAGVPNEKGASVARSVMESFYKIIAERKLVSVATEHVIYENMALFSVAPSHSAPFKGAINLVLKFQQVNLVGLQSVGRAPSGGVKRTAVTKKNNGEVQAKPVKESGLYKALGLKESK